MRRGTWRSWLPLVFLILSILFLILHETRALTAFESGLQVVVAPLQRAANGLVEGIGDLFQTVRQVRQLRAEVEELLEFIAASERGVIK